MDYFNNFVTENEKLEDKLEKIRRIFQKKYKKKYLKRCTVLVFANISSKK